MKQSAKIDAETAVLQVWEVLLEVQRWAEWAPMATSCDASMAAARRRVPELDERVTTNGPP